MAEAVDEHRKELSRKYAKKAYANYKVKRKSLLKKFGDNCWICGRTGIMLVFHHLVYGLVGQYRKGLWRRILHLREIEENPSNFRLLCVRCHQLVTALESLPNESRERLTSILQI